ncbi:MAG: DUF2079 domain-containing protein [Oscillospiraceae bacterium]|nr:DUF2079 domain-containing protein [Oscillospiraceae bacterium]MBQ8883194.1 DUF2079 domain-containing protein [Oscillospiraceae bacterium]
MEKCKEWLTLVLNKLKDITFEDILVRFLSAWAMLGICENIRIREGIRFTSNEIFEKFGFAESLVLTLLFFAMLWLPIFQKAQKGILWGSFFILFIRTLWQRADFGYFMGATLIMTIITLYSFKDVKFEKDLKKPAMWALTVPFTALVVTVIILISVLLYKAVWTPTYDFGIFSQMFYYMKEGFIPYTTCERDKLLSHFAVHFSPIYYLLLPFYFIFPSPVTLLVLPPLISASGIIPLVFICKKYKHSNLTTLFLTICYMGIPAITGGNLYYIHENVFLSPLLLWMFYFFEKKNVPLTVVFAFLVMLVKEDAPVYIFVFALYLLISKRNKSLGLLLMGLAIIYFAFVLSFLERFGEGAMVGRFENFNKSGEPITLIGVIMTAFSNPAYLISECFENNRMMFLLQFFIPLMFMPFFTTKLSRFILLFPIVIVNLLSDYGYQHEMGYQYVFGPLAFVIYLCVMNSADMEKVKRSKHLLLSATASVMVFFSMYYGRLDVVESYRNNMPEHIAVQKAIEVIPDDASVAASTFFVANLSQREEIYELESTKQKAEYYVLDLRYPNDKYTVENFISKGYEEVYLDQYVAIYKSN